MTFNSLQFAVFFGVILFVYWRLRHRAQNVLLLLASWTFYALFDVRFLGLMLTSTVVDYTVGRTLDRLEAESARRRVFFVSLAVNLGILGFFKYFGFFVDSGNQFLHRFGLSGDLPTLHILLPVGISFYTFHGISYTFDVFRREIRPARQFVDFAVFVAYFPQLVAGPIGRAHVQLPQFERERTRPDGDAVDSGWLLILVGLFKKVAIADALAPYVNSAFGQTRTAGWSTLVIGALGFTLQIYGDFSGYSDIARGASRLLGIELPINFTEPFLSRNITEFWQRWHISLSTWLRDYLYVPLGGNRNGRLRTYRNLLITMLLGGLWHGAAITFVVWGGIHGTMLALHRMMRDGRRARGEVEREPSAIAAAFSTVGTFLLVVAAFVVFRARRLSEVVDLFRGIVTLRPGPVPTDALLALLAAGSALFVLDVAARRHRAALLSLRPALTGVGVGIAVTAVLVFSGGAPVPFIYFQF